MVNVKILPGSSVWHYSCTPFDGILGSELVNHAPAARLGPTLPRCIISRAPHVAFLASVARLLIITLDF